jgi:beta-N-acetylhexosaminidase
MGRADRAAQGLRGCLLVKGRILLCLGLFCGLLALSGGIAQASGFSGEKAGMTLGASPERLPPWAGAVEAVPLAVQMGQMIMVGFRGLEVGKGHFLWDDIRKHHLGGVILFDYDVPTAKQERNIASRDQVRRLVAGLQAAAAIPLLVAVDQEGGRVRRLKERHGFPPALSHRELGLINDLARTAREAGIIAATLADLGINLNLAPVVDLCAYPDNPVIARLNRCFGASPEMVVRQAREFILAHRERGILTALKHFPGHGSSREDSHEGFVEVTRFWQPAELLPFQALVAQDLADAVMTAHIFNARLDASWPATLSPPTLQGILRRQWGYEGVIIADDLQMGAIINHWSLEQVVEQALAAGVDILLFANNSTYEEDIVRRVVKIMADLVTQGRVSPERIAQSYNRIMKLKGRLTPKSRPGG